MFRNALISVNWSGTSVAAAALARRLCADDARLTLAHVHAEVPLSPDPLVMHLRKFELRHSMRALKGAAFATEIPGESTLSVGAPTIGEGMSGLVSMIGADLLILGPVDRADGVADDLSEWLIDRPVRSLSAIAIAPAGFSVDSPTLRRIGVISDGSRDSHNALAVAQRLAVSLGSRVKAFEVSPAGARTHGPRRAAIVSRRLTEFSARVDLLVSGAGVGALHAGAQSPLLMITRPALPPVPAFQAAGARPAAPGRPL